MKETIKTKIGFNLLVWSGGLPEDFLPITERLRKIGYDGVECFMEERDINAYKKFGAHLKNLELEATCVLGLGPDENPISESKAIREKAVVRLKKLLIAPMH
jgi:D-psicose/D-tagatose/L-ribulose 3-epimerase